MFAYSKKSGTIDEVTIAAAMDRVENIRDIVLGNDGNGVLEGCFSRREFQWGRFGILMLTGHDIATE
jgi:hypothetical protein